MTVRVLYFASLQDRAGTREEAFDVPALSDVEALWREAQARHPGLAAVTVKPMVACDMAYARWDRTLDGVREVAFLPPVSGG
jgi:molybdopterin synthase sulfur carrier subunit